MDAVELPCVVFLMYKKLFTASIPEMITHPYCVNELPVDNFFLRRASTIF